MSVFIDNLIRYRQTPTVDTASAVYAELLTYDFSDFWAVLQLKAPAKLSVETSPLYSSGSFTRLDRTPVIPYYFGPLWEYWWRQIELLLKNPTRGPAVYVCFHSPFWGPPRPGLVKSDLGRVTEQSICGTSHFLVLDYNYDNLEVLEPFPTIAADPKCLLYLLKDPKFTTAATIQSTHYEAFFPKLLNVFINDNCIDWKTGLNFYTCRAGTKHFLPIFALTKTGFINLLNLAQECPAPADDLFIIEPERCLCSCGRYYMPFTFLPHYRLMIKTTTGWFYDLNIPDHLQGRYKNLQFIQENAIVKVLAVPELLPLDRSYVEQRLCAADLSYEFIANHYLSCPNFKAPSFLNNTLPQHKINQWLEY